MLPRPSTRVPMNVSPDVMQWMRSVQTSLSAAAGGTQGPLGVGGMFPSLLPGAPDDILAIISQGGGSGSGDTGSGRGGVPADDQPNAYEWVEGIWSVVNDDFVVTELQGGRFGTFRQYPAVEMNGVEDVPEGAVVRLKQVAAGVDTFYEFSWSGEISGSGSGGTPFTVDCGDGSGSSTTYTIRRSSSGGWEAVAQ